MKKPLLFFLTTLLIILSMAFLLSLVLTIFFTSTGADPFSAFLQLFLPCLFISTLLSAVPVVFSANRHFTNRPIGYAVLTALYAGLIFGSSLLLPSQSKIAEVAPPSLQPGVFLDAGDRAVMMARNSGATAEGLIVVTPRDASPIRRVPSLPIVTSSDRSWIGDMEIRKAAMEPRPWLLATVSDAANGMLAEFSGGLPRLEALILACAYALALTGLWCLSRLVKWPLINIVLVAWGAFGFLALVPASVRIAASGPPIPDFVAADHLLWRAIAFAALGAILIALDLLLVRRPGAAHD